MPVTLTYPGVYVEEIPSGVRTITGVATSITAFIGRARRGPVNKAITINSFGDFERIFGGLWVESALGYAVRDFFLNGGSQAIIVRLFHPYFATQADRAVALEAANQVSTAAATAAADAAAIPAAVAQAARGEANKPANAAEPRKSAADAVATAAEKARDTGGATKETVKDAANKAVNSAAPQAKAKLAVGDIKLEAAYEGKWGAYLRASVDLDVVQQVADRMGLDKADLFNLTVTDTVPGGAAEQFRNLSVKNGPRRIDNVLKEESKLVRWDGTLDPAAPPAIPAMDAGKTKGDTVTEAEKTLAAKKKDLETKQNTGALQGEITTAKTAVDTANTAVDNAKTAMVGADADGSFLDTDDFIGEGKENAKQGLYALRQADLFNLLCIPPYQSDGNIESSLIDPAAQYCEKRRALLLVDPPTKWNDKDKARDGVETEVGSVSKNAALFFPRLKQPNPLRDNQMEDFVPCGAVAGIFARTDTQRGVWKAPAGLEATLFGVPQLSVPLTDAENGELNPKGINCLRAMPAVGRVVWGARTREGDDRLASEWKYIPVRRVALYIEESLYRGTQWVVFEPNDEPLWAQIRLNVGAFMHNLFRQGAFQGTTPRDAYFVKCDKETTTQNDINLGIVNIVVGFAPLKPAEFVIIKLQQMAGQIEV